MARLINPKDLLGASSSVVGDLLKASRYQVPDYQRDFSWGVEELCKLWDDVMRTRARAYPNGQLTTNREGHFLGAIVTQRTTSGGRPEVIDGQQRLSTIAMLLSVLYEFADQLGDPGTRSNVTAQVLSLIADPHAKGRDTRLVLAREHDFFDRSVIQSLNMAARHGYWSTVKFEGFPVRQRIRDAVVLLHESVKACVYDAGGQKDSAVTELVDVVTELLMVLHLEVIDHRMAYRVFETLNFRGLDLSQADLIKNELVRRGQEQGERTDVVKDWAEVVKNLDKVTTLSLVEFLQFHYASKYASVRASDLFEAVTERLDSASIPARTYTQDLVLESARLVQVIEGDTSVWSASANAALAELRDDLGYKFAYPLLMSAAARFVNQPSDFDSWAMRTRDFCFRYMTIGRKGLTAFESAVTAAARKLRDSYEDSAAVLAGLRQLAPDDEFMRDFTTARVNTNKMGFYVIRRIEDHISSGSGKTFPQGPTQHLEHIMPKKPGAGWGHVSDDPRFETH